VLVDAPARGGQLSLIAFQNSEPHHETLVNVTTDDVYYARRETILEARRELKPETLVRRKAVNLGAKPKSLH